MDKFTTPDRATACPLDQSPTSTPIRLLPARYLKWPRSNGIGKVLLQDLRFDADGRERPDFPLNRPAWRGCQDHGRRPQFRLRLVARGRRLCALRLRHPLRDRAVVWRHLSGNAIQNGLLTATVTDEEAAEIMATWPRRPDLPLTIDLEQQTILCGNRSYTFSIDPVRRMRLLNGWDDIALTESFRGQILAFKTSDKARPPLGDAPRRDMKGRTGLRSQLWTHAAAVMGVALISFASVPAPAQQDAFPCVRSRRWCRLPRAAARMW